MFSTIVLGAATVLTLLFIPLVYALNNSHGPDAAGAAIAIPLLQFVRAGVLTAGLVVSGAGRKGAWLTDSQGGQLAAVVVGVLLMEATCCAMHFLSLDYELSTAAQWFFGVLGTLLPALLLMAGFWPAAGMARILFLTGVGSAVAAGLGAMVSYPALVAPYRERREAEARAQEELEVRRVGELERLPVTAGVAELLPFAVPGNPDRVQGEAMRRIRKSEGWAAAAVAMLAGKDRLGAVYLLRDGWEERPEAVKNACWRATGEAAREMAARMESGQTVSRDEIEMLFWAMSTMSDRPVEEYRGHLEELTATRDTLRNAEKRGVYFRDPEWLTGRILTASR